jgi:hypothetical protein
MKYPRQLSSGANNTVIALSQTEVAKLYTGDTRSEIGSKAEKMQFANTINGLWSSSSAWTMTRACQPKCS